jgi:hypothetical protein
MIDERSEIGLWLKVRGYAFLVLLASQPALRADSELASQLLSLMV